MARRPRVMRGGVLYAGSAGAPAYSKAKKVRTRGAGRALASSRRRSSCTGAFAHLLQQSESVRRRRQRPSPPARAARRRFQAPPSDRAAKQLRRGPRRACAALSCQKQGSTVTRTTASVHPVRLAADQGSLAATVAAAGFKLVTITVAAQGLTHARHWQLRV